MSGSKDPGPGRTEAFGSNGSIKLDLPPESQFRFDCSTSNARVSCDFAHSADSNRRGTHVKGSVGDEPMASIAASTSNGSIQIRKASIDQDYALGFAAPPGLTPALDGRS